MRINFDFMQVEEILKLIPEEELEFLAAETSVDHQVKKLTGLTVFKLILFSMLNSDKLSLRIMESFFESAQFKKLTGIVNTTTKYNSIRDRISTINNVFFEKIFERIFEKFNQQLKEESAVGIMDSTFINISSKLVHWGMENGTKSLGLKYLKLTVSLKGSLPSSVQIYQEQQYVNDNVAFPDAIFKNKFLEDSVLIFDRGLQTRKVFNDMSDKNILFVARAKTDAKYKVIKQEQLPAIEEHNTVELIEDIHVRLYQTDHKATSNIFRLIKVKIKSSDETMFLITNFFTASAYEIAAMYKQRWSIEIYFKFLKQHLNLKHLVSRNENAIKVMIYMTLILSTLIIVYKKANKISSFKIAKVKFEIELDKLLIKEIVLLCGGNPSIAAHLWNSG